jgi:hypothetical protein
MDGLAARLIARVSRGWTAQKQVQALNVQADDLQRKQRRSTRSGVARQVDGSPRRPWQYTLKQSRQDSTRSARRSGLLQIARRRRAAARPAGGGPRRLSVPRADD